MLKRLQRSGWLLLLLVVVGGTSSCRFGHWQVIKIVSSLPMQGTALMQTQTMVNAIRMALAEADYTAGPFHIEYEAWDDATAQHRNWDAEQEKFNAQKAVADPDVMVYIGTFNSGAARVAIPITNPANLVMISPSATYVGLTQGGPYSQPGEPDCFYPNHQRNFCRLVPNDVIQASAEAAWARSLGAHQVAIVHGPDAYGVGLAQVFSDQCRHLGLTVMSSVSLDADQDPDPIVKSLKAHPPDLVYFGGNTQNGAGELLRALRDAKVTSLFMGPDGIRESAFIDEAGLGAEGAYASLGALPVERLPPLAKEWFDRYRQTYQSDPEPYTLYAYEAARVVLQGIERAGVKDRKAIRDAILATRNYDGVLGRWSFTSDGDTTIRTITGYQVHNHHFEFRRMLEPE